MPTIDLELMYAQANLEHQLGEARAGLADAKLEIAVFNLPLDEQALAWPEGPPVPLRTLQERVRRYERQIERLEPALLGADDLAAK